MTELTCDAARWSMDSEGDWLSLRIPCAERRRAQHLADELTRPHRVEIRQAARKRSLDANAYCWVLLDKLAQVLRTSKLELYRDAIRCIGGNSETVCVRTEAVEKLCEGWQHNGLGWVTDTMPSKIPGCTVVVLYYGSSTYDTRQMARLIDLVIQECRQQGIETMTPEELERLVGMWDG